MTQAERQRRDYIRQHSAYERRVRPIFLRALRQQIEPVVRWLEFNSIGEPPIDMLIDTTIFRVPMQQAYVTIGMTAAKRGYYQMRDDDLSSKAGIDLLIDLWSSFFRMFALNYAYRIENELSETTKEEIRKALAEARELGYDNAKAATLIRKKVQNQISRTRATLIARTEATTASNMAQERGARSYLEETNQSGYQQWIGREDARERHTHRELNDDIIPMGQKWQVGQELADMPGDTNLSAKERCNCRCTRLFMTERRYRRLMAEKN